MKDGNKSFLKSISILTTGSAISMVFLVILHFVSPKVFTPEELGIKSVILAIPMAVGSVLCGRYDLTLVYEPEEKNVFPLLKLNFVLNLLLSTILTVVTLLYLVIWEPQYLQYWYTIPAVWVYLVAYGLTLTLNSYNNRYREYGTISKMHAIRSAAQCLGTVILGLIFVYLLKLRSLSVAILVIPFCLGMAAGIRSQGKSILQNKREIISTKKDEVLAIAKKHIRQPLLSAPAIFANSFSYSLITMMINGLYGEAITGYYSLSVTLLGLPITLISGNMSKVYMRDASTEYEQTGRFMKAFKKNFFVLFALSIPMFLLMYFVAPPLTAALFGEKWRMAGEYIKILSVMFTFRFITTALSCGLYVCKKQLSELILQILFLAVTALAGALAYFYQLDSIGFMKLIVIFRSAVMVVLTLVVAYYAAGKGKHKEKAVQE